MTVEKVLWGRKEGQTAFDEQVITCTADAKKLADATAWAKAQGFKHLRVQVLDGKAPDFTKAIN